MPESVLVWKGPDPASGSSLIDALATFDHESWLSRTSEGSLFGEPMLFSGAWPVEGMTRNGRLFERRTLARHTAGPGSSSLLTEWTTPTRPNGGRAPAPGQSPTGMTPDGKKRQVDLSHQVRSDWPTPQTQYDGRTDEAWELARDRADLKRRNGDYAKGCGTPSMMDLQRAATWMTPRRIDQHDGFSASPKALSVHKSKPSLFQQTQGIVSNRDWPTPIKEDSESRTAHGTLTDAVRDQWPTPTGMDAAGFEGRPDAGRMSPNSGRTLTGAAKDSEAWRTPSTRDWKGPSAQSWRDRTSGDTTPTDQLAGLHDQENRNTTGSLRASSPRPVLNPRWVACLMGFPADYLDGVEPPSARSGTRSSRKSPKSSRGGSDKSSNEEQPMPSSQQGSALLRFTENPRHVRARHPERVSDPLMRVALPSQRPNSQRLGFQRLLSRSAFGNASNGVVGARGFDRQVWPHQDQESSNHRARHDIGGASRFYYCAKPSREERDMGCYDLQPRQRDESRKDGDPGGDNPRNRGLQPRGNFHPTVKPVELMRWLVRLVTPPNGVVLDPFLGSGTTGMACVYEQRQFIGIEREAEYIEIAKRRIAAVAPLFTEAV